ncbi:hypothetical protein B484DRAFT_451115 [Ochromonadaceae sp. CCMP2298]|nr:hypothetical protein B484DRAFT_451115 [Ochromonadaceae sp. CCMP2298]
MHLAAGRPNRARLFQADFCQCLVSLLANHITDADAVRIISRTISIASFGDACRAERDCLANAGACKILTKGMQYHEGDEAIARGVCWAVKALAYHHHLNREALRGHGVSPMVIVALRGYRYSPTAGETVQAAAAAVANLCQDNVGNKAALGEAGACEGVLEVMELHYRTIEVAYLTSKALFHLLDGNTDNRLKASFSGGADILMLLVSRYADEDRILDYVFSIMVGLSVGRVGQSRLGTVGACTAVVSALYRYEKTSEYMVMLCCTLVHSLARASADNQGKLGAAGACRAVAVAIFRYAHSGAFAGINAAPLALTPELDGCVEERGGAEVAGAGAVEGDVDSRTPVNGSALQPTPQPTPQPQLPLSQIVGQLGVLKEGCRALCSLCAVHESNRSKFQFTNVLDVLTQVLASSAGMGAAGGGGVGVGGEGEGVYSDETMQWVKSAVDALIGR